MDTFHQTRVSSSFRTSSWNTHWVLVSSIFRVQNRVWRQVYQVCSEYFEYYKFYWVRVWLKLKPLSSSLIVFERVLKVLEVSNSSFKHYCIQFGKYISKYKDNHCNMMKDRQTFEELDLWYSWFESVLLRSNVILNHFYWQIVIYFLYEFLRNHDMYLIHYIYHSNRKLMLLT